MKESILHRLYSGELYPAQEICAGNPHYSEVCKHTVKVLEKLVDALTPEQLQLFEQYREQESALSAKFDEANFIEGFRLGANLMIEITDGDNSENGKIPVCFSLEGKNDSIL